MNFYHIARRCGVSTATVSQALRNSPQLNAGVRNRIVEAVRQEGYDPDQLAAELGYSSMGTVGILCTDASDWFFAKALSLLEDGLRKKGLDTLFCCTGVELESKRKGLELLLHKQVDGVLLIGSVFREERDNSHIQKASQQVPVVLVNGLIEIPGVACVACDEWSAMRENVLHLAAQGVTDILYVYDELTYSGIQKLKGYREGLQEVGSERELACKVPEKSLEEAQRLVSALLQEEVAFSGVLASEDVLAIGAQKALAEAGRSMPVIGFNNSLGARCATPALTSVDNMLETMCSMAVQLMTDALSGQQVQERIVIPARLVQRESFRLDADVEETMV